jgi:hypothetical protein
LTNDDRIGIRLDRHRSTAPLGVAGYAYNRRSAGKACLSIDQSNRHVARWWTDLAIVLNRDEQRRISPHGKLQMEEPSHQPGLDYGRHDKERPEDPGSSEWAQATILNAKAKIRSILGQSVLARQNFNRAVLLVPNMVDGYINLAASYINAEEEGPSRLVLAVFAKGDRLGFELP